MIKSECETVIQYDMEERTATMFTRVPKDIKRLDNLCKEYPNVYECTKRSEFGNTYKFDRRYVTIRAPRKLSEEQAKVAVESLNKARASRKK
jgi:hypothetical protein